MKAIEKLIDKVYAALIGEAYKDSEANRFVANLKLSDDVYLLASVGRSESYVEIDKQTERTYPNIEKTIADRLDYYEIRQEAVSDSDNMDIWQSHGYTDEAEYWRERI